MLFCYTVFIRLIFYYRLKTSMTKKIEISLSKRKSLFAFVASVIIAIVGVVVMEMSAPFPYVDAEVVRFVLLICVVIFFVFSLLALRKLIDRRPGLIIDENGIVDNSGPIKLWLIEWKDITHIETGKISSTKFLILHTDNPTKYLSRVKGAVTKYIMKQNYEMCGSPLTMTSGALKINFKELEALIHREWGKHR